MDFISAVFSLFQFYSILTTRPQFLSLSLSKKKFFFSNVRELKTTKMGYLQERIVLKDILKTYVVL